MLRTPEEVAPEGMAVIGWPQEAPLEDLAEELGIGVGRRSLLRPRVTTKARSLSRRHGLGAFPWHTDGAERALPPAWFLLRSLARTRTPTLLLDSETLLSERWLRRDLVAGVWLVEGGSHRFHSSVISLSGAIRWNPDIMQPRGRRAYDAEIGLRGEIAGAKPIEHEWKTGQVLLLDNRRWLHSRAAVSKKDQDRLLERIQGD